MSEPQSTKSPQDVSTGGTGGLWAQTRVRTKLIFLLVGVSLAALAAACVAFVIYDRTSYADAKRLTLEVLVDAVAQSAMGPVAFGDGESAGYVLQSIGRERSAVAAAVYTQDGELLADWVSQGSAGEMPPERLGALPAKTEFRGDRLLIRRPIEKDGVRSGELYAAFSTTDIDERTQHFVSIAGLVLLLAVLGAWAVASVAHVVFTRPIHNLVDAATRLQQSNDYTVRAAKISEDELGLLTDAFNGMIEAMGVHERALEAHNQQLEHRVRERTHDLDVRNAEMRLVLDNVDQGFVTLSRDGMLLSERSLAFDRFFGVPAASSKLWDHLEQAAPECGPAFELSWEELVDGMLPLELTIDQMPSRIKTSRGSELVVEYRPIMEQEELCKMLVIFTDVSGQVARERAAAEQAETIAMFEAVMHDQHGFKDFVDEAERIVQRVIAAEGELADLMRDLHTLKGNLGISRLHSMAEEVHHIESRCLETGEPPAEADRELLQSLWAKFRKRTDLFLGERGTSVSIDLEEFLAVERMLEAEGLDDASLHQVRQLRMEKVEPRLRRLGQEAARLSRRLGRGQLAFHIEGADVRMPESSGWLWSLLPHLVRNAVDHGYRPLDNDVPRPPVLNLRARLEDGGWFVLEVADEGYGIRWERLRALAESLDLPAETEQELVDVMFRDQVSTQEEVSDVSGRGVGLSAVRAAVIEHGGRIDVTSVAQVGTTFTIRIPVWGSGAAAEEAAEPPIARIA